MATCGEGETHLTRVMVLTEQEHEETIGLVQASVQTCEQCRQAADQTTYRGCEVFFSEGF